jgi:hypothetical protein
VLVGFVINIAMNPITSIGLLFIVMLGRTEYEIPVIMGTWRVANKYEGSKIWAALAKTVVVFAAISLSVGILGLLGQA